MWKAYFDHNIWWSLKRVVLEYHDKDGVLVFRARFFTGFFMDFKKKLAAKCVARLLSVR